MIASWLEYAIADALATLVVPPRRRARRRVSTLQRNMRALAIACGEAWAFDRMHSVPAIGPSTPAMSLRLELPWPRSGTAWAQLAVWPGPSAMRWRSMLRYVSIAVAFHDAERRLRNDVEAVLWSFLLKQIECGAPRYRQALRGAAPLVRRKLRPSLATRT